MTIYLQKNKITIIALLLIVTVGVIAYTNSLKGQFIWDDEILVKENIYIRSWANIPKIFSSDVTSGSGKSFNQYYRPLQILTYLVDYSLWKFNVIGYHLTNIVLHILAALCIFWLFNVLFNNRLISFLAGILFVIHPAQTESVSYISGRADILSALFTVLTLIFYIKSSYNTGFIIASLMSYALALLSKENALVAPLFLLLYHFAFRKKIKAGQFAPFLILTIFYLVLRFKALNPSAFSLDWLATILQRIPGFFASITKYLSIFFLPLNLHFEYGQVVFGFTDPKAVVGFAASVFMIFWAFKKINSCPIVFFSIMWFFIALLPTSNIYPLSFYMAEHFLYLPSAGLFLLLAYLISEFLKGSLFKTAAISIISLIIIFCTFLTIRQNNYWGNPEEFYKRTLRFEPGSAVINNNLGSIYVKKGNYEEAITLFKKALQINPGYAEAFNNIGLCYASAGKTDEAIASYNKAIEVYPRYAEAYNNLGISLALCGKPEEAKKAYNKVIEINPGHRAVYFNLANIYSKKGENALAIDLYKKAIEIDPDNLGAYNNMGILLGKLKRYEEAISIFRKVLGKNPNYVEAYNNLGGVLLTCGKNDEAIELYKKAIEIDPSCRAAYHNLAVVYSTRKEYKLANQYYQKALEFGSKNSAISEARKNIK